MAYNEDWFLQPNAPKAPVIYNFDPQTGEYVNESVANPSPREYDVWLYPAYSTTVPPLNKKQGKAIIWNGEDWQYLEDYRGQIWFDNDGNEVLITTLTNPVDSGLLKDKPLTEEPAETLLPPLSARQFWQAALVIGVTEDGLTADVSDPKSLLYVKDDAERESVLIDIKKTTQFSRDHYLIEKLSSALDIPVEQLDSLWKWASQIQ